MIDNVKHILDDVPIIRQLLEKYIQTHTISLDEEKVIVDFFTTFQNTNELVDAAIKGIHENPDETMVEFTQLQKLAAEMVSFCDEHHAVLKKIDFEGDADKCLKSYEEKSKKASKEANVVWREFQEISNRLDYMIKSDDDWAETRKACDEKEELYHQLDAHNKAVYAEWQEKISMYSAVYYFKMSMLELLFFKLDAIAKDTISDIHRLQEKGGLA